MDSSTKTARDQYLCQRWTQVYLPAAMKAKKRFQTDTDEIDKYFKSDHDHLYDEVADLLPRDNLLTLTVNLAAQIRGYMAPHLYSRNPVRVVTTRCYDPMKRWLAKVADVYLNATPSCVKLKREIRDAIDDALLPGRGVGLVYKHPELDLITTKHVSIDDLLIDPDARCLEEAQWIAIRRVEPLHEVKRKYKTGGKDDPTKDLKKNATSFMEGEAGVNKEAGKLLTVGEHRLEGSTSHLCLYFEIWSKFGAGLIHGKAGKQGGPTDFDMKHEPGTRYRYMVIAPGHNVPLKEGAWPVPLYLEERWPICKLDFTAVRKGDKKDPLWPVSLMKLGLSHQKSIDLLCTILINDTKFKSRTVAGVLGDKAEEVKEALTSGDLHVAINLDPQDGVQDIRQIIQLLDLGQVDPQLIQQIEWHERKFGEITGLNPILKGGAAQVEAQIRSATESSMRDRNSRSRLEDMNENVEDFNGECSFNEFLAMRLACSAKEVQRVVEGELPPAPWKLKLSLGAEHLTADEAKKLVPQIASYYPDEQSAQQALQEFMQEGHQHLKAAWEIDSPEEPFLFQAIPTEVTVKELWFDTSGVTAQELVRDYKVVVEAGSARKLDWNLKQDQAQFLLQELGQRSAALGLWDTYNKVLNKVQEIMQLQPNERMFLDTEKLAERAKAAMDAEQKKMQEDHMRKAQLDIGKQEVKDRNKAQQIVLDGKVQGGLQHQRFQWQAALDQPGSGGSR